MLWGRGWQLGLALAAGAGCEGNPPPCIPGRREALGVRDSRVRETAGEGRVGLDEAVEQAELEVSLEPLGAGVVPEVVEFVRVFLQIEELAELAAGVDGDLVAGGGTLVGPKSLKSPSLI